MSRLCSGQNPKIIRDTIEKLVLKFSHQSIDFILLYSNSLYMNANENSHILRKKTLAQMITHKRELEALLKRVKYPSCGFHFVSWDEVLIQENTYTDMFATLEKLYSRDNLFKNILLHEIKGTLLDEANINFILEETILTYLIRERLVKFTIKLSEPNPWYLIAYFGCCLMTDVYIYRKNIFKRNKRVLHNCNLSKIFMKAMYNCNKNILERYDEIKIEEFNDKICKNYEFELAEPVN